MIRLKKMLPKALNRRVNDMKNVLIGLIVAASLTTASLANETITGAGATFPYPIYSKWADAYKTATGRTINYQSIGSGAGIKQIQSKTVTFGASDMPLTDAQLKKDDLVQFPMVIGGNVLVFNLDGVKSNELVLSGPVIADIYLGKIKKWNDPAIVALNPSLKLPDSGITVVRRSDGSGTTFLFARYLASVSDEWKTKVGVGTAVEWPVGVGGKGNEGVSANVKQTKNSIGYVEYAFAKQNQISYAALRVGTKTLNAGKESFQSEWPIAAPTFIIMQRKSTDKNATKIAIDFFQWSYDNGDKMAEELDYVPLSKEEKLKSAEVWKQID